MNARRMLLVALAIVLSSAPVAAKSVTWTVHRQGKDAIWSTYAGGPKCFVSRRGSRTSVTCTR